MSRASKSRMQENNLTILLSSQEKEAVVEFLGRRCVTLATAVVQLWMALPHSPCQWSLQHTGTVCFVKDNPRQSYFICRFNIKIPLFTLLQYALCVDCHFKLCNQHWLC
ncbi:wiskott-Aldrich syndrome protein-like [Coregonus clupeaformis]|uniref:wiskott-Aldrich syndrome protein-like n=1 Tax=Coregonus clupeaformis TaxID=59861 RepID=UPI001BE065BA|nr:wiskott-Aldrich syndrome protein-like [Coregonus clupeaformis]